MRNQLRENLKRQIEEKERKKKEKERVNREIEVKERLRIEKEMKQIRERERAELGVIQTKQDQIYAESMEMTPNTQHIENKDPTHHNIHHIQDVPSQNPRVALQSGNLNKQTQERQNPMTDDKFNKTMHAIQQLTGKS